MGEILSKIRCSSEWENGGMQKCFQILVIKLPARHHGYRKQVLQTVIRLWNVRTRKMSINQIGTVFE